MTYEPSDVMVEAAARKLFGDDLEDYFVSRTRLALRAAFAAAIESGEAREAKGQIYFLEGEEHWSVETGAGVMPGDFPCLILRTQEGEK